MKMNILIIPIIATLLSCKNNLNKDPDYVRQLNFFREDLVDQFPREGEYKYFSLDVETSAYYNTVGIIATFELSEENFFKALNNYKAPPIENKDSNITVVNSFLDNKNYPEPRTIFCGEQCIDTTILKEPFYVLPNFYLNRFSDSSTLTRLPDQFKHIPLEQKTGIYSDKIDINKSTMPSNIFHGFSKGISFNKDKNVVIYWTIVW